AAIANDGSTGGNYADVSYATAGTTSTVTGLPAGNYVMTVSDDANTCDTTATFTIVDDFNQKPTVTLSDIVINQVTTCNPAQLNGEADASGAVTGGSGSYAYAWYAASDLTTIIDSDAVLGSSTAGSGRAAGDYVLNVTDALWGCTAGTMDVTIEENLPTITINASRTSIDYTCDSGSPSGAITAGIDGGSTGYTLTWYKGNTASGTIVGSATTDADNTQSNLAPGSYTVLATNNTTLCTATTTVAVEENTPTFAVAISGTPTAQTTCNPANGSITAATTITHPGTTTGYTSNLSYKWYAGQNAITSALISGETSATLSAREAGFYTVIVTDQTSGCSSAKVTGEIADSRPAAPTITLNADNIPSSCAGVNGELSGTITGGTGPFEFFWYEGSDDFADLDPTGADQLVSGDNQLAADASITISVTKNATTTELDGLISGLYTLVVKDAAGCRYQETYDLPFNGIQTTTSLVVSPVTTCPDNGTADVSLADNLIIDIINRVGTTAFETLEEFTTDGGATKGLVSVDAGGNEIQLSVTQGSVDAGDVLVGSITSAEVEVQTINSLGNLAGEADDIQEYIIYLYSGAGVPADRLASYDVFDSDGNVLKFPYTYDARVGDVLNASGDVISSPGIINNGDTVTFSGLPAGAYTAIAREKDNNPNGVNGGVGTSFFSQSECWTAADSKTITQEAFKPIISSVSLTDDSYCNAGTGNGQITITGIKNTGDTDGTAGDQPNNFSFELLDNNGNSLGNPGDESDATTATFSNLNAGTYQVLVTRVGLAGPASNGCDTTATYTINENPEVHEISNDVLTNGVTNTDGCNPLNGAITITNTDLTDDVGDYRFTWYDDPALGSANEIDDSYVDGGDNGDVGVANVSDLPPDTYYVVAEHTSKGCSTAAFEVVIDDNRKKPIVNVTQTAQDETCDDGAFTPTGQATANAISGGGAQTVGDYIFTWYESNQTDLLGTTTTTATFNGGGNNTAG
ncbi:MAG: hypothetical protein JXR10_18430, partial [Cyclobacteriaceae bacterium]